MIKKVLYFSMCVMLYNYMVSQTVGKYKFKEKDYLVFPYRIANAGDIPMLGYNIPDGEYLAFSTYNFKEKLSFRSEKKHVLTDTTIVAGIFTIKANQAHGPAVFYNYEYGNRGRQYHKPNEKVLGNFVNGLKNGEWKTMDNDDQLKEIKTYKDGVAEGYLLNYEKDGLQYKEKYCGGRVCDTFFYYSNGKLVKEYDQNESGIFPNEYARVLFRLGIRPNRANTFYREYDHDGKLVADIKLNSGEVLPFDSMNSTYSRNGEAADYATIKKINERQTLFTFYDFNYNSKSISKEYFENDFMYKKSEVTYYTITKRKWFLGKRKITGIDTVTSEELFVDRKTLADTGLCPVLIHQETKRNDTYKDYYIPRYNFSFSEDDERPVFKKVDTTLNRIYLDRYDPGYYSGYVRQYEQVYFSDKQQLLLNEQSRPFLQKDFIVTAVMDYFEEERTGYNYRMNRHKSRNFINFETKSRYSKDSVLLNGMYCLSPHAAPKHAPKTVTYTGDTGPEDDTRLGQFANGSKEGQWLSLHYSRSPKRVPLDFKDWFFNHPKKVNAYEEENYKNGMLDGLCVYYEKYDPKNSDWESKEPVVLYRSKELHFLRDTLHGNCKVYYASGKLMREVNMVMGAPDGELKTYSDYGTLARSVQFKKGRLDGPCLGYSGDGLYFYAFFKDNCLRDSAVYYYSDGKPSMGIYARQDTLLKKITYYEDRKPKEVVVFDASSRSVIAREILSSESFIETLKRSGNTFAEANGSYKNYYDNGQLLSEGNIKKGKLNGLWKFYSLNGVLVHEVNFTDTTIRLPGREDPARVYGLYTGYYSNGAKRCTGYIKYLDLSYDCFTKQDKADLDFYVIDFHDIQGKQTLRNGNGYFIKYDENGLRLAAGKLKNCVEDSLWRYYTPEQRLKEIGHYVNGEKEGVWYQGSLEGINFEDGACFDMNDPEAVKEFNAKRKALHIVKTIYRKGISLESSEFYSDLNKNYESTGSSKETMIVDEY